jgi:5'-3' exonuclease
MLLDTASLYFRAFFGLPDSLRSPAGEPVNAVRGLLDMIAFLVTEHRPERLVACWDDDWRPAFRVAAIPSYKQHRVLEERSDGPDVEEMPDALRAQVPVIVEVLAALGIARVGAPGFEADDVIGTLVAREVARSDGGSGGGSEGGSDGGSDGGATAGSTAVGSTSVAEVAVVTGDRDLFQLVDDAAGVTVLYPARGIRDPDVVDQARLTEKYAVPTGTAYAEMAVLRGDPSDGLPGVAGIGEKTAAKLLATVGTLDRVLAAASAGEAGVTPSQRTRIAAAADYLAVAPGVVRVADDAPVGDVDDALPRTARDPEALEALVERWGIRSSVERVTRALAER